MENITDQNDQVYTVIQASRYDDGKLYRVCPKCKKEIPMSNFGYRKMDNGTVRNQSWCKVCRSNNLSD